MLCGGCERMHAACQPSPILFTKNQYLSMNYRYFISECKSTPQHLPAMAHVIILIKCRSICKMSVQAKSSWAIKRNVRGWPTKQQASAMAYLYSMTPARHCNEMHSTDYHFMTC